MEKQRAAFPRPANRVTHSSINKPVIHISTNAGYGESYSFILSFYQIRKALPYGKIKTGQSFRKNPAGIRHIQFGDWLCRTLCFVLSQVHSKLHATSGLFVHKHRFYHFLSLFVVILLKCWFYKDCPILFTPLLLIIFCLYPCADYWN